MLFPANDLDKEVIFIGGAVSVQKFDNAHLKLGTALNRLMIEFEERLTDYI